MLFSALDDAKFARIFIVDSNSVSFSRVEQLHGQVYNNEINFLALLALFKSHPTWFVEVANVSKYFFYLQYLPTCSTKFATASFPGYSLVFKRNSEISCAELSPTLFEFIS